MKREEKSALISDLTLAVARSEVGAVNDYDYVVVNDDLDRCVESVKCVVRASRCRTNQRT